MNLPNVAFGTGRVRLKTANYNTYGHIVVLEVIESNTYLLPITEVIFDRFLDFSALMFQTKVTSALKSFVRRSKRVA